MDFGLLVSSFGSVFAPLNMLYIFIGAAGGVLIGCIPGLTSTMGIALLIPFTYGLDLLPSVGMLLGIFCGAMYGGSISAILIHTPGTPAAAATVMDGYPMSKRGEPGRALSIALFSSFMGGMIGALCMTFLSPYISKMALKFGPAEFFSLAAFGLSVIISISGKSLIKGLITAFFGLLISTVGMDKTCAYLRFFKFQGLYDGIPFIPALIGLFAISEVLAGIESNLDTQKNKVKISGVLPSISDIKTILRNIVTGGFIGSFIGSIPGAGGDIAAFVSYSEAKRSSKHPEKFGTGIPEGIAASESANNGCSGGAMIPMLSLGVPGDSNTAVLMGAFIMKGFQPGPMMYVEHLDIVYAVFASLIVANLAMLVVGMCGIKGFAKIISVERKMLLPVILMLSLVGAYAINQNMFDVFFAIIMGVIGYLLQKYEFPLSPILLALILGPMSESNLRRFMQISDGQFFKIFTKPICCVFLALAVISMITSVINQRRINKKLSVEEDKNF
ncbi:tripartite tricarboxylate transporter permease [Treponema parvum]|uniref:Tripartite tricarboxylate transporter permease n=1 Tax=Treponema parvum TaxID=138851 RepID=A0A975F5N9_9SPIR|nr:tripartite tricarboxylate transporter permease [Treponema parvum]QTQ14439.1 tripartite tricarboxylate transporter permease [Treponema parvum]